MPFDIPPRFALGVDFGTSGARACLIAVHAGKVTIEAMPRIDFAALDEDKLAASWREVLFDLIAALPLGLRQHLGSIAIDGTSATVLACNAARQPLHAPLMYHDARGQALVAKIAAVAGATHTVSSATSSLAKALWLHDQLQRSEDILFLHQADWLAALLHGRAAVSDYHNALKMGFPPGGQHWPAWMTQLIPLSSLPRVQAPGQVIAPVSDAIKTRFNLPADCTVISGTTDSMAAFLASGAHRLGDAVTSLGSTLVLKQISAQRIDDARLGVYSHWFGTHWLVGGASNAGGAVLRQFFSSEELRELSAQIDPSQPSGLDYYPLLKPGERFPINDPMLPPRLTPRPHDNVHFLHGLLESLARIEAQGYAQLATLGAPALRRVLSSGGGAQNPTYSQLRASALGVPVLAAQQQEAAYGAALLAAYGTRVFTQTIEKHA